MKTSSRTKRIRHAPKAAVGRSAASLTVVPPAQPPSEPDRLPPILALLAQLQIAPGPEIAQALRAARVALTSADLDAEVIYDVFAAFVQDRLRHRQVDDEPVDAFSIANAIPAFAFGVTVAYVALTDAAATRVSVSADRGRR